MTVETENYKSVQQTSPSFSAIFGLLIFFINHSCFVKCFLTHSLQYVRKLIEKENSDVTRLA